MPYFRRRPIVALAVLLAACAPPSTPIAVTLTASVPTPTVAPISLSPPMEVGSTFVYIDGTTLVAVPHGPFAMGHGSADNPEHTVTLSDYWIYSTEVSNHQYSLCVSQGRCASPDSLDDPNFLDLARKNDPVVGVTYDQARAYCNFLNADLPSEAQWEKAARGDTSDPYPWGAAPPSCGLLNFNNCLKHTSEVTANPGGKSPYGALNMAGNVYEWVGDWYDPLYYKASPPGDPPGPDSGKARVVRSSSYRSNPDQAVTYARSYASPADHRPDLGFRCAVKDLNFFAPACQVPPAFSAMDLASATIDCPVISIDVKATACRYGGGAVVTFNDDHSRDPNASFGGIVGCTLLSGKPGSFPLSYQCKFAATAVMSSSCTYSGLGDGFCPTNYDLDAQTQLCQWRGARTPAIDCPTGEFYDPVHHCCLVTSGRIQDFPVCPVGSVLTETAGTEYACLPAASMRNVPSLMEGINPPDCPNLCGLTTEICSLRNLVFCPNTCACLAVGVKCPTH